MKKKVQKLDILQKVENVEKIKPDPEPENPVEVKEESEEEQIDPAVAAEEIRL